MIGDTMSLMSHAEKLSVGQLQHSIQSGVVPAYVGIPILQKKVQEQKEAQGMQMQPPQPPVAAQVMQQAQAVQNPPPMPVPQQSGQPQGQGIPALQSNLPESPSMAEGGVVSFAEGGTTGGGWVKDSNGVWQWKSDVIDPFTGDYAYKLGIPEWMRKAGRFATDVAPKVAKGLGAAGTAYDIYKTNETPQLGSSNVTNIADLLKHGAVRGPYGLYQEYNALKNTPQPASALTPSKTDMQAAARGSAALLNEPDMMGKPKQPAQPVQEGQEDTVPGTQMSRAQAEAEYKTALTRSKDTSLSKADRLEAASTVDQLGAILYGVGKGSKSSPTVATPSPQSGIAALPASAAPPVAQSGLPDYDKKAILDSLWSEDETDPAKQMATYRQLMGPDTGADKVGERIKQREAKMADFEERAPWMALMQAGLATMGGTSPFAAVNIGQGAQAGLNAFIKSQDKLQDMRDKYADLQDRLDDRRRAEDMAAAKYGIDSAQHNKAQNKTLKAQASADEQKYNLQRFEAETKRRSEENLGGYYQMMGNAASAKASGGAGKDYAVQQLKSAEDTYKIEKAALKAIDPIMNPIEYAQQKQVIADALRRLNDAGRVHADLHGYEFAPIVESTPPPALLPGAQGSTIRVKQ